MFSQYYTFFIPISSVSPKSIGQAYRKAFFTGNSFHSVVK